MSGFDIAPEPDAEGLTANLQGLDAQGQPISLPVVQERPLTIYLNRQEIITAMTLGDRPKEMAVGFLFNQNMLKRGDVIIGIDYDDDIDVVWSGLRERCLRGLDSTRIRLDELALHWMHN